MSKKECTPPPAPDIRRCSEPITANVAKACAAFSIAALISAYVLCEVSVSKESERVSAKVNMDAHKLGFDISRCYCIGVVEEYEVFYVAEGVFLLSDGNKFEVVKGYGRI